MKNLLITLTLSALSFTAQANSDVNKVAHLYLGEVTFKSLPDVSGNSQGYLQNLAIINSSDETLTMEVVTFEFFEDGKLIHEKNLFAEDLFKEANQIFTYEKQGIIEDYGLAQDVQKIINGATFSDSRVVNPNEVLLFRKKQFNLMGNPERIVITARGYDENMNQISMEYEIAPNGK